MRVSLRLDLPRDSDSVPAVRRLLRSALSVFEVDRDCGDDLEIALTEACANVVKHASGADSIQVQLDLAEDRCAIDVSDNGAGFDADAVEEPTTGSDRGRGLFLIKALSENVRMQSSPRRGSLIHFEKAYTPAR